MNAERVRALPAVLDVPTAADVLSISRTAAYELVRADAWPTPVFHLGRLIRVPTAPLLALLGLDQPAVGAQIADVRKVVE